MQWAGGECSKDTRPLVEEDWTFKGGDVEEGTARVAPAAVEGIGAYKMPLE